MKIIERILHACHATIRGLVGQQEREFRLDAFRRCSDNFRRPGLDRLGPLRDLPQDEYRFAKTRRLLLYSAGIGHNEIGRPQQLHELEVIERVEQRHVRQMSYPTPDDRLYIGVEVNRTDEVDVVAKPPCHALNGLADAEQRSAEVLPPMRCHGDDTART